MVIAATDTTAEMREYDRTSTAAINAYVQPKVSGYMGRLAAGIEEMGIGSRLWIMQSNGGLLNPETAATHSARTVLSGLAGGVVGAGNWARHLGLDKVVSFDIGGTSTDIALISDGEPDDTTAGEIDSSAAPAERRRAHHRRGRRLDRLAGFGRLPARGPALRGADPGPISYQRGGTGSSPTRTVLGRLARSCSAGIPDATPPMPA